jgi:DNA sulfur modification protein DndC
MDIRRNKQVAVREDGTKQRYIYFQYRYEILKDLLLVQKEVQRKTAYHIINNQELIAIQVT